MNCLTWFLKTILVGVFLFAISPVKAQKDELIEEGVDLLFGVAEAVIEWQLFLEDLELQAANQILATRPDIKSFRLKVLGLDNTSLSDISSVDIVTFAVVSFDKNTLQEIDRSVFLMTTSRNWVSDRGIEFDRISWKSYDKLFFSELYSDYVDLVTPCKVINGSVPIVYQIDESDFIFDNDEYFYLTSNKGKISYYRADYSKPYPTSLLYANKTDFQYLKEFLPQGVSPNEISAIPLYSIKGDDYLVSDFDETTKLVFNEKRACIFDKTTNELIKLDLIVLNQINLFLNGLSDEVIFGRSIEERKTKADESIAKAKLRQDYELNRQAFEENYSIEISFEIGVQGLMIQNGSKTWEDYLLGLTDDDDVLEFSVVDVRDENTSRAALRIAYFRNGRQEEKWIRAENENDELRFEK